MKKLFSPAFTAAAMCVCYSLVGIAEADDFIVTDPLYSEDQLDFGKRAVVQALEEEEIERTVALNDGNADICIMLEQTFKVLNEESGFSSVKSISLEGSESFSIRLDSSCKSRIFIVGKDAAGAMYGALEVAGLIRIGESSSIQDTDHAPYMKMRGTKFNIPLDVRTPTYTESCDAAQNSMKEMWSLDFWKAYIDQIAEYRYNYISLWNLHPFPSMVKVPDYPAVALKDVRKSTVDWEENYPLQGTGFDQPEIVNQYETLYEMSIEEKMEFWREVMAYGKKRNVDFYVVTWNIFVNGTDGKYGIDDDIKNEVTRDYFKKSITQMFLEYPDLAGIGLTTGENMPGGTFEEKEDWAYETYGLGVLDATKELPDRKIRFIHRQHQTGASDIAEVFKPLVDHENIDFIFSFKYAKAHVYSSIKQPYHENGFIQDIGELKTIWTLRNDDVFYFRWGAPDFVREFVKNIPYGISQGYYYGSDQYVWGRDFLSKFPSNGVREIEVTKHWYQWMLWGRLGYDPNIDNKRFEGLIGIRFPGTESNLLFEAWQEASMVYPKTTGFHWGALDFQWYIEGAQSLPGSAQTPTGFHDINRFITLSPHPGTDYVGIPLYVDSVLNGTVVEGRSPVELAQEIHLHSDRALEVLNSLTVNQPSLALVETLNDIRTIALLGKYFAYKIDAAISTQFFRKKGGLEHHRNASTSMQESALYWRKFVSQAVSRNRNPLWTNRVGYVDWRKNMDSVIYDLRMIGADTNIGSMTSTSGGIIFEAEDCRGNDFEIKTTIPGYSGSGYVNVIREGNPSLSFDVEVEEAGNYFAEIRYSRNWGNVSKKPVLVNGEKVADFVAWQTGDRNSWGWDRISIGLQKGVNCVTFEIHHSLNIDHINIIKRDSVW